MHKAEDGHSLDPKFPCPLLKETDGDHRAFSEYSPPTSQERESDYLPLARGYSWSNDLWSEGHSIQTRLLDPHVCVCVCVCVCVLGLGE